MRLKGGCKEPTDHKSALRENEGIRDHEKEVEFNSKGDEMSLEGFDHWNF